MSCNKHTPHLLILPEDDANRELANGFLLDSRVRCRNIQILKPAGGWLKAVKSINTYNLDRYEKRQLLLLIDFDDDVESRQKEICASIPENFKSRVYILGTASEPEKLNAALGRPSLENIGLQVANACANNSNTFWEHPLLEHNLDELGRLIKGVRDFVIRA